MSFRKPKKLNKLIEEKDHEHSTERGERRRNMLQERRLQGVQQDEANRIEQLAGALNREIDDEQRSIDFNVEDMARPREQVPEGPEQDDGWREVETQPIIDPSIEIQQAQVVDDSRYLLVNHEDKERELTPQIIQDNHNEIENDLSEWVRDNYDMIFETPQTEEPSKEIAKETDDNTREVQEKMAEDSPKEMTMTQSSIDEERIVEIIREIEDNEKQMEQEIIDNTNQMNQIEQQMEMERTRESLERMLVDMEDDPIRTISIQETRPDPPIQDQIYHEGQQMNEEEQDQQMTADEIAEMERRALETELERVLDALNTYIKNHVDFWKNRNEQIQHIHRFDKAQTLLTIVRRDEPNWMNSTLEERKQLLLQLAAIPAFTRLDNTAIEVKIHAGKYITYSYPLASIKDEAIYFTREKFQEDYDERKIGGYDTILPLEEINEIHLVINHRDKQTNTPRITFFQGNFFPFYLDPLCCEDKMIEEMKLFEIFTEKDWCPKENCFFMALVHWNEYWSKQNKPEKMIPEKTLTKIKFRLRGNGLTKKLLEEIGLDFDIYFKVKLEVVKIRNNEKKYNSYIHEYNKEGKLQVDLAMIIYLEQGHFIIDVPTKFTVAGVNNYFNLRAYKENKQIATNGRFLQERTFEERIGIAGITRSGQPIWNSNNKNFLDSSSLIALMLKISLEQKTKHRFFVEIPNYMLYRGYFHGVNTKYVENVDVDPKIDPDIKLLSWKERKNYDTFYVADTECCTQDRHKPYAISHCPLGKDTEIITDIGPDCITIFCDRMNEIVKSKAFFAYRNKDGKKTGPDKKVIVYFHNLSYDGRMFADQNIIKITMGQNRIIEMVIKMECGKWLYLRDSYMLIPSKLANFPGMFGTAEKEKKVFPYSFITMEMFNDENFKVPFQDIINCYHNDDKKLWTEEEVKDFEKVCSEDIVDNNHILDPETNEVNIHLLVKNYVESDVKILSQGLTWFRENIKQALGLDVTNYLSISALAYDYFKKEAYEGEEIYEYTGQVRDFIRQAVYGGRCMTRGNNAYKLVDARLLDIDACSLYPSAMSIMNIPKGMPKKMPPMSKQELERRLNQQGNDHYDAVIVRIRITSIERTLQFPLICERNKSGIVMYENYENAELVVDDIQLMEMVKWQGIDYNIVEGIYWNEGVSTKINEKIKEIYERRKQAKSQNPPNKIEQIYKMLMNSSYGKCIEMAKPYKTHIVEGQNYINHLFQNYTNIERIDEIISFDNEIRREEIEEKMLNNTINEDEKQWLSDVEKQTKFIFRQYQQYDNFFVPTMIGVRILSYSKKLMNEVMVPAELEGILIFYQDTDSMHVLECQEQALEDAWRKHNGKEPDKKLFGTDMCQFHSDFERVGGKEAVSHSSIFLGKKMYLDVLTARYEETNEIKMMTRMKGISKESLEHFKFDHAPEMEINEKIWSIYDALFNGQSLQFELVIDKTRIQFTRNLEVKSISSFKRTVNAPICKHWEFDEEGNWNSK